MSQAPSRKDIISAIITNPKLDEEQKSILIEELMDELKKEYPDLKNHATKSDVAEVELKIEKVRNEMRETELKLIKEIEEVRGEIKEVELKLTKEIEKVRNEIKEVELKLTKEIEKVRGEIKEVELRLSKEIKETKFTMLKWQFIFWISQIAVIAGIGYKLLH